jgi:hypothetical protein
MHWVAFAIGAALSWGMYGPALHQGQVKLGSPFRALLCVGFAYMVIGMVVPLAALASQGDLTTRGWSMSGAAGATVAGALGATGAIFIIYAFRAGGLPTYVMPLVFVIAPLVNVEFSMYLHPPKAPIQPMLSVGFVMVPDAASLVHYFKPHG